MIVRDIQDRRRAGGHLQQHASRPARRGDIAPFVLADVLAPPVAPQGVDSQRTNRQRNAEVRVGLKDERIIQLGVRREHRDGRSVERPNQIATAHSMTAPAASAWTSIAAGAMTPLRPMRWPLPIVRSAVAVPPTAATETSVARPRAAWGVGTATTIAAPRGRWDTNSLNGPPISGTGAKLKSSAS